MADKKNNNEGSHPSTPPSHLDTKSPKDNQSEAIDKLQRSRAKNGSKNAAESFAKADRCSTPKRRKIRRNALKHGLSVPVSKLPYFQNQIDAWHQALLNDMSEEFPINDEISGICYEIAVQQCELQRISEMKRVLSSQRLGSPKTLTQSDIIHLITVIEGFIITPRDTPIPFNERTLSMLYRIFGVRRCELPHGVRQDDLTPHQIKRLSSFERYETRASIRMKKAIKRLKAAIARKSAPTSHGSFPSLSDQGMSPYE